MSILEIPHGELAAALQQRFGSSAVNARDIAKRMLVISPALLPDLQSFWDNGTIALTMIDGWTMDRLINERAMKPLEALLTLDWILREPTVAARSLTRGRDRFSRYFLRGAPDCRVEVL